MWSKFLLKHQNDKANESLDAHKQCCTSFSYCTINITWFNARSNGICPRTAGVDRSIAFETSVWALITDTWSKDVIEIGTTEGCVSSTWTTLPGDTRVTGGTKSIDARPYRCTAVWTQSWNVVSNRAVTTLRKYFQLIKKTYEIIPASGKKPWGRNLFRYVCTYV